MAWKVHLGLAKWRGANSLHSPTFVMTFARGGLPLSALFDLDDCPESRTNFGKLPYIQVAQSGVPIVRKNFVAIVRTAASMPPRIGVAGNTRDGPVFSWM